MLATPQLSEAIGLPKTTPVAEHWPGSVLVVMLAAQTVIAGGWLSTTITRWVQMVELPDVSLTVQTTKLVPTEKLLGALLETVVVPQLSEVIGLPKTTPVAEHWPGSVLVAMLAGQAVIAGGWLSTTVTVCVQPAALPEASVTVQCTSVTPTEN